MISHHHKCIFVHIPKAAGTSIGKKLGIYDDSGAGRQDHRSIKYLTPISPELILNAYKKPYARTLYLHFRDRLAGKDFVNQKQLDSYFKFTFVRNPWARVFSWYRNVLNDPNHLKTYSVPEDSSLAWFVENRLYTVDSQQFFIRDLKDQVKMDFIGRYENLHEDFTFVCKQLGIEDTVLPEETRIGTPSYIAAYEDKSIATVARAFSEDIEMFDYEFGDKSHIPSA